MPAAGSRLAQRPVSSPILTHIHTEVAPQRSFWPSGPRRAQRGGSRASLTSAHLYTQPPALGRANSIPYTTRPITEGWGKVENMLVFEGNSPPTTKDLSSRSQKTSIHSIQVCTHARVHLCTCVRACPCARTHTGPGASTSHPLSSTQEPHSLVMSYTTTATVESRM